MTSDAPGPAIRARAEQAEVEHLTPLQRFINRSRVKPTDGQIEHASGNVAALRSLVRDLLAHVQALSAERDGLKAHHRLCECPVGGYDDTDCTFRASATEAQRALTDLRARLGAVVQQWRANADMLAEGNKSDGYDPSADMQRALANDLAALLDPAVSPQQDETKAEADEPLEQRKERYIRELHKSTKRICERIRRSERLTAEDYALIIREPRR